MRMWKINPKLLCKNHLLGEHYELHKFVGALNKSHNLTGYITNGLMEIHHIRKRHKLLANEMGRRGMNHKSELSEFVYRIKGKVDPDKSIKDLSERCSECRNLIKDGAKCQVKK